MGPAPAYGSDRRSPVAAADSTKAARGRQPRNWSTTAGTKSNGTTLTETLSPIATPPRPTLRRIWIR